MTAVRSREGLLALLAVAIVAALAAGAGLLALDHPIAASDSVNARWLAYLVRALNLVTGKALSDLLLPAGLLAAGSVVIAAWKSAVGRILLYIGAVQLCAEAIVELVKFQLGRLRPEQVGAGADMWFAGGDSFPSGHAAFYAGLVLPMVRLFPRSWPLLLIPALVAAQRILSDRHYLSDVSTSVLIAALLALLLRPIAPRLPAGAASVRST